MHILRGDRSRGIVLASSDSMKDARGTVIGGVVIFYDITEHKRMEEKLKSTREELGAGDQGEDCRATQSQQGPPGGGRGPR